MVYNLDFEKPIVELENKISELEGLNDNKINIKDELAKLRSKAEKMLIQTYSKLEADQKVQVARHPERPHCVDYIKHLIEDFTPLAGDRRFGDDDAIIGGIGRFRGYSCVVIGQEKGRDTEERLKRNFGMPKPEGYRKAQRLMDMASHFRLPIITFVDTAGAYPGIDAEERGQAEAIAASIDKCLSVETPLISTVIGEGGSGGAIAIATADKVLMLEHSIYSVISPEGCASILWRSSEFAKDAAKALKLTAQDLHKMGIIDEIITEPLGGAHRNPKTAMDNVGNTIEKAIKELIHVEGHALKLRRRDKFLKMGSEIVN